MVMDMKETVLVCLHLVGGAVVGITVEHVER